MRPAATDPLIGQQRQQPLFGQWIGTDFRCIDTLVFNVGLFDTAPSHTSSSQSRATQEIWIADLTSVQEIRRRTDPLLRSTALASHL
jgi:hypothetical protein